MFTVNGSVFKYGSFINALISFVLIAAAVYYVVVVPMNKLAERRAKGQDPTTKECPRVPERDRRRRDAVPALRQRTGGRELTPARRSAGPREARLQLRGLREAEREGVRSPETGP